MKTYKKVLLVVTIIALAAALTVGVLAIASATSDDTVDHGEKFEFAQASVSGEVNLKFYYSTLGSAEYIAAEVIDPATGKTDNEYVFDLSEIKTVTIPASVTGDVDMECYCVTVPVAPSQMTHTVRVYAGSEAGIGKAVEYSVAEYCNDVLANEDYESYHDSMRALLNWGAMAQTVFGDAEADLANSGMYALNTNPIDALTSISYTQGSVTDGESIKGDRMSLSINPDDIVFHFYVNYTGAGELSATVSKNGSAAVKTTVEDLGNGSYRVNLTNMGVAVFDKSYTVKITDGKDTFTATKSVLEYLSALSSDAEYADVAKSMYQLYVVTMNKIDPATCQHQLAHRLSADADTSYAQCSRCFEIMGNAVSNKIDKYMPAEQLSDRRSSNGTITLTQCTDEDGTTYVRLSNMITNANGWASWNPITENGAKTYTSGRYLVMKIRVNANQLGQTYHKMYVSSTRTSLLNETQGVSFKATEDAQWHISVIDLATRVGNSSGTDFVDNGDGTYSIKYLQIRPFSNAQTAERVGEATMDVAYIALCDELSDIGALVSESTYEWSTGTESCQMRYSATGYCVTHPGEKATQSATEIVYSCTSCAEEFARETYPESTNKYLGTGYINNRPTGGTYQITASERLNENGTYYHRFTGQNTTGQIFWTRMGYTGSGAAWGDAQLRPFNVGTAKYVVVKMRGNNDISSVRFNVGTIVGEASYDNYDNMKVGGIDLPQGALNGTDWTYFVVDLEKTYNGYWNANTDGTYNVCYLQFTFNGTSFTTSSYFDISYIAFVDNWTEVGALTGQDAVKLITESNKYINVEADTGACITHSVEETVVGNTYTYTCTVCGNTLTTKTVSEDVNWYASIEGMSNWSTNCTKTLGYDPVAGVAYASYTGSGATHINVTGGGGAGSATTESYSTGKYLVMMYRGKMSSGTVRIKMSTTGAAPSNYDATRAATDLPADWSVAVLDLSAMAEYTCNSTGQIYIMLNPGAAYSIDIAYAAIVDSLDEILSNGDAYVDYGTSFANAGTKKTFEKASKDFYLTAEDIASAANTNGYALGSVEMKNDEEFEYVRIYNNTTGTVNGHWAHSYADAEGKSGQYLIFKYRTNVTTGWMQFATSSSALVGNYFSDQTQRSWYVMSTDTEWHTVIVDMGQSVSDDSAVHFLESGTLAAQFVGFRPFYNSASRADAYMDFAYVKWAITAEEAAELVSGESNVDFGYYSGGKWHKLDLPQ